MHFWASGGVPRLAHGTDQALIAAQLMQVSSATQGTILIFGGHTLRHIFADQVANAVAMIQPKQHLTPFTRQTIFLVIHAGMSRRVSLLSCVR